MIATEHQRHFSLTRGALYLLRQAQAGLSNMRQITRPLRAGGRTLRLLHSDIAQVFDFVAERRNTAMDIGNTNSGRTHVDTTPARAQIHRSADDCDRTLPHHKARAACDRAYAD